MMNSDSAFPTKRYEPAPLSFLLVAFYAVFRHRRLCAGVFLASLAIVAGYTLLTKRKYRSEMKFIVQSARSNAVLSPEHANTSVLMTVSEEQLNSELEILQSEDVIGAIADPSWDRSKVRDKSSKAVKEHEKRLATFTKNLTVDPTGKADVMTLSFLGSSPEEARSTLEHLAAAYLAQHERLQRPSGTSSFYEEQAAQYESQWHAAAEALVAFQQKHHLVSVPDLETQLEKSIADDEDALRVDMRRVKEAEATAAQTAAILHSMSPRQATQERTVPSELLLQQLEVQMSSLQNHRTELLNRYQPTDRLVLETDKQIYDTNAHIAAARSEQETEKSTDVNPSWQQLTTSLAQSQIEQKAFLESQATHQHDVDSLRERLADVQSLSAQFDRLRSQSEQAEANFEAFVEKRDRARVEDAMDARRLLNVSIMEHPTISYLPAKPRPVLNMLLGLPTALLLVAATLYLLEAGRSTFSTPAELEASLRQPVLATIAHDGDLVPAGSELSTRQYSVLFPRTVSTDKSALIQS
jgi:uncharacterized protein involved in exopolysaccharide biosynthesis